LADGLQEGPSLDPTTEVVSAETECQHLLRIKAQHLEDIQLDQPISGKSTPLYASITLAPEIRS
jgi:hypothetical protein